MKLTAEIFERMELHEDWMGYGYIGERDMLLRESPELLAAADQYVLETANALGMTEIDLFYWANSRLGRHFATGFANGIPHHYEDVKPQFVN